jgi:general secretion pathway protein A
VITPPIEAFQAAAAEVESDAPEEAPQATLSEELALAGELTTREFALASLFAIWNLEYTSGAQNGCSQAAASGLTCVNQRGSWNGLRQLNHPAILSVIDESGSSHELVLTKIYGDTAELSIGGVVVSHPVSEISDIWFGQYMLLWRPPGGIPVSLSPGSRGAEVIWLRQSLADIDDRYLSDAMTSDEYDANLQNIVRQFQRDNRLDVDGLAGQQTLIIVNSLLGTDASPRLTSPRLAQD